MLTINSREDTATAAKSCGFSLGFACHIGCLSDRELKALKSSDNPNTAKAEVRAISSEAPDLRSVT